ncbi:hypothetical protein ABIF34_008616 [Bradyrhizobium japonicum]
MPRKLPPNVERNVVKGVLPHISMLPGAISCLIYFAPGLS